MKKILLTLFTALLASFGFAQVAIVWEKTYGGTQNDNGSDIIKTPSGGLMFSGSTSSSDGDVSANNGGLDYWVAGLFNNQQIAWEKNLGGSGIDIGRSALFNANGHLIVAGSSNSINGDVGGNFGGNDLWIADLEFVANTPILDSERTIGGSMAEAFGDMLATSDGGYLIIGGTNSNDVDVSGNNGDYDNWVVKLNATLGIEWQKCIGGSQYEIAYSVTESHDGGYLISGIPNSMDSGIVNHGDMDGLITKLDSTGNIVWVKNYGGSDFDSFADLLGTSDGGYVLVGSSKSSDGDVSENKGDRDLWIVKINDSGDILWEHSYGGSLFDIGLSVIETIDGGYAIAGYTASTDGDVTNAHGDRDAWIVKINREGLLRWQKTFGGTGIDQAKDILQNSDGTLVFTGDTESSDGDVSLNNGLRDIWVVKLSVACSPPNIGISSMNNTITSAAPENFNFQWIDCSNNTIIEGENSSVFLATQLGDYAVVIADGLCKDTTDCVSITAVSVQEIKSSDFKIYPNPTTNWVQIKTEHNVDKIEVYDVNGRLVLVEPFISFSTQNWVNGIYFLKIKTPNGSSNVKLIKN